MRVISGQAKGRALKAVAGMSTRPTTDKVKEAIFSMIGPYFDGGIALDLFAGTGGLGIEALSRGMERAIFVDMEAKSISVIRHNLQATGLQDQAEVYRNEAGRALKALIKRNQTFDLVLLDPPYMMNNLESILAILVDFNMLNKNAVIVVEHDGTHHYKEQLGLLKKEKHAEYGETYVDIFRLMTDANTKMEEEL